MATRGDACISTRGQTDANKSSAAGIMEAAAVAVAVLNTAAAIQIVDQQIEIANQYLTIAKWWNNWHIQVYRACEDRELAEACSEPLWEADFDTAIGRARTSARIQFGGAADKVVMCTTRYATGLRAALMKDQLTAEASAISLVTVAGYRNEWAYKLAKDDVRWKRREQTLNRGRDMEAQNINFSQLSNNIFGNLFQQASAGAAGAIGWLGYSNNRLPTGYPPSMVGGYRSNGLDMVEPVDMFDPIEGSGAWEI